MVSGSFVYVSNPSSRMRLASVVRFLLARVSSITHKVANQYLSRDMTKPTK